jgi:hypothetical protein
MPVPQGKETLLREYLALLPKKIDLILDACMLILSKSKLQSTPSSALVVGGREVVQDMIGETPSVGSSNWVQRNQQPLHASGTVSNLCTTSK